VVATPLVIRNSGPDAFRPPERGPGLQTTGLLDLAAMVGDRSDDRRKRYLTYEEYHPYGTTSWWASNGSTDVSAKRYRYTGKEKDEETGLGYHGARFYALWLGRWERVDPAGIVDGPNRFAYCRGNPVGGRDPTGLSRETKADRKLRREEERAAKSAPPLPAKVAIAGNQGGQAAAGVALGQVDQLRMSLQAAGAPQSIVDRLDSAVAGLEIARSEGRVHLVNEDTPAAATSELAEVGASAMTLAPGDAQFDVGDKPLIVLSSDDAVTELHEASHYDALVQQATPANMTAGGESMESSSLGPTFRGQQREAVGTSLAPLMSEMTTFASEFEAYQLNAAIGQASAGQEVSARSVRSGALDLIPGRQKARLDIEIRRLLGGASPEASYSEVSVAARTKMGLGLEEAVSIIKGNITQTLLNGRELDMENVLGPQTYRDYLEAGGR